MNCHRTDEAAGLQQRHTDGGPNLHPPISVHDCPGPRVELRILDDKGLARPHRTQAFGAEVAESVVPDDARRAVAVIAGEIEAVLIRLDLPVGAAARLQIVAQVNRRGVSDVRGLDQRPHDVVERQQEFVRCSLGRHFSHESPICHLLASYASIRAIRAATPVYWHGPM